MYRPLKAILCQAEVTNYAVSAVGVKLSLIESHTAANSWLNLALGARCALIKMAP